MENSKRLLKKKKKQEKLGIKLPYDPAIHFGACTLRKIISETYVYPSGHSSAVYNSQDMEAT